MGFLRLLEALRTPALSAFFSAVTRLGDVTVFMIVAMTVFWCIDKRRAYYIFLVGFVGTAMNQWLKLLFRVPRPWVLDPSFTIVESARAAATGYSFPSGHTQNIVGTMGVLAVSSRSRALRAVCVALMLLVPFSRMYLGVHTPLDVGAAFVLALALTAALYPAFSSQERFLQKTFVLILLTAALCLCYLLFSLLFPFGPAVDAENLQSGRENGFTLLGCAAGLVCAWLFDRNYLHFDTRAPLPGQALKLVLGLALLMAVRVGVKALLAALAPGFVAADMLRYFLMVLVGACLWPMTFPFFARVGAKEREHAKL